MIPLVLLIGCDCDPDRPRYGGIRYDVHHEPQRWRGISEGINVLREVIEKVEKIAGIKLKVIFCVRSDLQMKEWYGSAGWMLEEYRLLWRELEGEGHEIAWHPHLWRWSETSRCWYQEVEDAEWIVQCLEAGHADFAAKWGRNPLTCHMGWTFHNNVSMRTISRLGLKMDFSASPGVFFAGGPGAAGTIFDNRIDWRGTPKSWYRPSQADYRRPGEKGESELDIIEIPKFTSGAGLLRVLKRFASGRKGKTESETGRAVFLQVTILPFLYKHIIKEQVGCERSGPFFASFFHPDELLKKGAFSLNTILYSRNNLEKNLCSIVEKGRKQGRNVLFATGPNALDFVTAAH
jgi:hypothetical protein